MEHNVLRSDTIARMESELTLPVQLEFTPAEIEFEMTTILEVLEDCKGNVTFTQFNVHTSSDHKELLQYYPRTH